MPGNHATSLTITLGTRSYPIVIQSGLLEQLVPAFQQQLPAPRKLLIVTDPTVGALYAETVLHPLADAGYEVTLFTAPEGEAAKSLPVVEQIYSQALAMGLSRKDAMVALGGGVMGDLTGFCAATYFRGTGFVQIPTTLLAQVDSSVGGKVGINFQAAKNGVGAFYQPLMVLADLNVLKTLSDRQNRAGMAEVIKYGLIETACTAQSGFWDFLEQSASRDPLSPDFMASIVRRSCEIKADVVRQDETETTGFRGLLNLGHTFAHAYEEITHYQTYLHGEAVAWGMVQACQLSTQLGQFSQASFARVMRLFERFRLLESPPPPTEVETLLALMRVDKKAHGGRIKLILPTDPIGHSVITDTVPEQSICRVLATQF